MPGSKPGALPLGDTPSEDVFKFVDLRWLGYQDSNLGMPGSKPGALPLGDTPILNSITEKENGAGGET